MYKLFVFVFFIDVSFSQNSSNNGKSYFFKMGKNNNQFKVNNRIMYLNHNITDLEYPGMQRKKTYQTVQTVDKPPPKFDFGYHLDKEWNYDHKKNTINKTHLPMFVKKFYDEISTSTDSQITTRILFNKNVNSSNSILKFNLDSMDSDDSIVDADLYFYWSVKNTSNIFKESMVLRLYQYERQVHENNSVHNPDVHKLFNVIYVSKAQKGWQMFKVKKPIDNWLDGEENLGLILTISSYDTNELMEIFHDTNSGNFSTFIMVKSQKNDSLPASSNNEISTTEFQNTFSQCRRQDWIVNFQKMGWDKFIIFPDEFSASDCVGTCQKPVEKDTNHAKFVYIFQKRGMCCVPVGYKSLPIMYFDRFGDIAVKNYNKAIVTECGCR